MFHVQELAVVQIGPLMSPSLHVCRNDIPRECVLSVYLFVLLPAAHLKSELQLSCF